MLLLELFKSVYEFKILKQTPGHFADYIAIFVTEIGHSIEIQFIYKDIGEGYWIVEFGRFGAADNKNFNITNEGDAYKILATVVEAINQFTTKYKPKLITFTASEPSRRKLYSSMAKRFNKKYTRITSGTEYDFIAQESEQNSELFVFQLVD